VKTQKPLERRNAILRAAAEEFFEHGYEATSIDAIIQRIGGSKRDLYSEFGNKEGLFVALISEWADYALTPLGESASLNLREALLEFGRRFVSISTSPAMLGLYRATVSEARRFPDLARIFYERGPGRGESRLVELLEAANKNGEAQIADCTIAASHFMGMFRDNFHMRRLLGLASPLNSKQVERAVISAVDIFLFGISASPKHSKGPPARASRRPRHE
jgi:AcrR family transcriptional regulator